MDFDSIKQALQNNGCSFAIIARALNKSHASIRQVATRQNTSKKIAQAISIGVGKPIKEVFPENPAYHIENRFENKAEQEAYWHKQLVS
ncbi:XRE family transcriptional regulator [Thalassomonas viridans]|uniref:XRE family transcriptional regulator n=1 Tax=Thalassomonas viridans TaxID=137584 RepID=A0AAE9Z5S5_9GAMM|nr:hypothetical protein [Thalassomonas viridans]WDE07271.1 XRE family transcriptional regulator [Thalassomonas viridans]